ncbi:PhoH family protein [bacterium]|nr:PhoH family protein [bacterium]
MARKKRVESKPNKTNRDTYHPDGQRSGIIPLRKKSIPTILPRNIAQEDYLYQLADPKNNICFAIGPAGTGKTLLCTLMGVKAFMEREVKKIVITRPAVSVDEQHGFLPGDLNEKMAPWTRPIFDIFEKHFSVAEIESMLAENIIEIAPLAYMRGRTFEDAWIIADEMQNATKSQMKMLLTRIGNNTKMIVTGDLKQHDRGFSENGLSDFMELTRRYELANMNHIAISRFDMMDVERHPAVVEVLKIYGEDE